MKKRDYLFLMLVLPLCNLLLATETLNIYKDKPHPSSIESKLRKMKEAEDIQGCIPTSSNIYSLYTKSEIAASNLSVGDIIQTQGYSQAGDGGGGIYFVCSSELTAYNNGNADEIAVITMNNGNFAILQFDNAYLIEQFGAKGNGTTDDTDAFEKATNYVRATSKNTLRLGEHKEYLINNSNAGLNMNNVRLVGVNSKIIAGNGVTNWKFLIKVIGTVGSFSQENTSLKRGDVSLTLSSTPNFAEGDLIKIIATGSESYANTNYSRPCTNNCDFSTASVKGEIKQISKVDGNTIHFETGVFDTYSDSLKIAKVTPANFYMKGITLDIDQDSRTNKVTGLKLDYAKDVTIEDCAFKNFRTNIVIQNSYKTSINATIYGDQYVALNITAASVFTDVTGTFYLDNSEIEVTGGNDDANIAGIPWETRFHNMSVEKSSLVGEVMDTHMSVGSVIYENINASGGNKVFSQGAQYVTIRDCKITNANVAISERDIGVKILGSPDSYYYTLPFQSFTVENIQTENVEQFYIANKDSKSLRITNAKHSGKGTDNIFLVMTQGEFDALSYDEILLRNISFNNRFFGGHLKVTNFNCDNITSIENEYTENAFSDYWFRADEKSLIGTLKISNLTFERKEHTTRNLFELREEAIIDKIVISNSDVDISMDTPNTDRNMFLSSSSNGFPHIYIDNSRFSDVNGFNRMFYDTGETGGLISISNSKIIRSSAALHFGLSEFTFFNNGNVLSDEWNNQLGNMFSQEILAGSLNNTFTGSNTGFVIRGVDDPLDYENYPDPNDALTKVYGKIGSIYIYVTTVLTDKKIYIKVSDDGGFQGWKALD